MDVADVCKHTKGSTNTEVPCQSHLLGRGSVIANASVNSIPVLIEHRLYIEHVISVCYRRLLQ